MLAPILQKKYTHFYNLIDADNNGILEPEDWAIIGQRFAHSWKLSEDSPQYQKIIDLAGDIWNEMSQQIKAHNAPQISLEEWLAFAEEKIVNGNSSWYNQYINGIVREVFETIDNDRNGVIDWREYIFFLSCLSVSVGNARIAFEKMDLNGDGIIDQSELVKCVKEFLKSEEADAPGNSMFGELK